MLTWPNGITAVRILFLPLFIIGVLHARGQPWLHPWLPLLFAFMALGDFLDGYLARQLRQHSEIGALVDPLADKITMSSAAILLAIPEITHDWIAFPIPSSVVVLLLARDLLILCGYLVLYLQWNVHTAQPIRLGKWTTAAQMSLILATLLTGSGIGLVSDANRTVAGGFFVLWLVCGALTIASGLAYLARINRMIKAAAKEPPGTPPRGSSATGTMSPPGGFRSLRRDEIHRDKI